MKACRKIAALALCAVLLVSLVPAALAAQADTVTRIFCGLPLELKG